MPLTSSMLSINRHLMTASHVPYQIDILHIMLREVDLDIDSAGDSLIKHSLASKIGWSTSPKDH